MEAITSSRKELQQFGVVMGIVIGGVFGVLVPFLKGHPFGEKSLIVAALFIAFAGVAPMALKPVHKAWMRVGLVLGWINSRIILTAFYVLLFVPIAMVMRMIGRDVMYRRFDKKTVSYRQVKTYDIEVKSGMERPF